MNTLFRDPAAARDAVTTGLRAPASSRPLLARTNLRTRAIARAAWLVLVVGGIPLASGGVPAFGSLVLAFGGVAHAASAGPQPATTGVPEIGDEPAEQTCVACHNSFALNPDADGATTLEGVPETYEPGRTYTLTLKVAHKDASMLRWGFQMTAVSMKDGAGAGEFVATDPNATMVLAAMTGTRSYIEQAYGGTAIGQAGGTSWSFDWKAPAAEMGTIGFFAAVNVSNADGSNQGDRVYSRSPLPLAETSAAR